MEPTNFEDSATNNNSDDNSSSSSSENTDSSDSDFGLNIRNVKKTKKQIKRKRKNLPESNIITRARLRQQLIDQ